MRSKEQIAVLHDLFNQINDRLEIIGETPDAYFLCQCVDILKQQGATIDAQATRITELETQLADAKQVANDCRIVADNAIAEALQAKKDAERYQWLRRMAVELSLSHQVISQFVTNQGELDAAIAEGKS